MKSSQKRRESGKLPLREVFSISPVATSDSFCGSRSQICRSSVLNFVFGCCFICILSPMHRADYAAVATCLSVCPSVTRRYSVEVAHQIYFTIGSPHHSSFSLQYGIAILWQGPLNGGVKLKGGSSSAVGERPRDASCLSAVSSSSIIMRAQSSVINYFGLIYCCVQLNSVLFIMVVHAGCDKQE